MRSLNFKTLLEFGHWFHVCCDSIIQIPLVSSIILVLSILLGTYEKNHLGEYFAPFNHSFAHMVIIIFFSLPIK